MTFLDPANFSSKALYVNSVFEDWSAKEKGNSAYKLASIMDLDSAL